MVDFTSWKDHDSFQVSFERLLKDLKHTSEVSSASQQLKEPDEIVKDRLTEKRASRQFDVLLCYNTDDRDFVIGIGERLKKRGFLPWLDTWELRAGRPWQEELEKVIKSSRTAAVFIGPTGTGPSQKREIRGLLRQFVDNGQSGHTSFSCLD